MQACVLDAGSVLEHTDMALLDRARRGDHKAQAELFRAHKDRVERRVQWMTKDASCVDDLVQ
jgi:DNA-directed RNA polymerase specialized sigma24 family protein